jgi:ParB family chromosome partitioning protein
MQVEFHQLEMKYSGLRIRDPRRQGQLVAALVEYGQQSPVLVVASGTDGRYVLIDGYRRVAALQQVGRDTVEALVLPVSEVEALCLSHRQEGTRRRSALEDGWFLRELVEVHGMSQSELGRKLGRSTSWVSRRLALVGELPDSVQELVRKGRLCSHGAMRHLVPLARANRAHCERLVAALSGVPVSARELGRLYVAWRTANAEERERIIDQPILYLKAEAAMTAAQGPPSAEEKLRNDLEAVGRVAHRATRRLLDEIPGAPPLVVIRVWEQVRLGFEELAHRMEERLHARSGHEDSGV